MLKMPLVVPPRGESRFGSPLQAERLHHLNSTAIQAINVVVQWLK
jgi:hypothetical protein